MGKEDRGACLRPRRGVCLYLPHSPPLSPLTSSSSASSSSSWHAALPASTSAARPEIRGRLAAIPPAPRFCSPAVTACTQEEWGGGRGEGVYCSHLQHTQWPLPLYPQAHSHLPPPSTPPTPEMPWMLRAYPRPRAPPPAGEAPGSAPPVPRPRGERQHLPPMPQLLLLLLPAAMPGAPRPAFRRGSRKPRHAPPRGSSWSVNMCGKRVIGI